MDREPDHMVAQIKTALSAVLAFILFSGVYPIMDVNQFQIEDNIFSNQFMSSSVS